MDVFNTPISSWDDCPQFGYPLFARIRALKDDLCYPRRTTVGQIRAIIGIASDFADRNTRLPSTGTVKNILAGRVKGNPLLAKGGSILHLRYLANIRKYLTDQARPLPPGSLEERMTAEEFRDQIQSWRATFVSERPPVKPSDVPHILEQEFRWSDTGRAFQSHIESWWKARKKASDRALSQAGHEHDRRQQPTQSPTPHARARFEAQTSIGISAPSRYGKTVMVAQWILQQSVANAFWFDCKHFTSREFVIDALLSRLYARQHLDIVRSGLVNAKLEDKKQAVEQQLRSLTDGLLIFDSLESMVFNPGDLPDGDGKSGERPKDPMAIEFLNDLIQHSPTPKIFVSQLSLTMFTSLQWLELAEPAWQPKGLHEGFPLRDAAQHALARVVQPARYTVSRNSLSAESIVDAVFHNLTSNRLKLFSFIVLIGESVRHSTLKWFCVDYLRIENGRADEFIDSFWRDCAALQATPVSVHCDQEHDRIIDAEQADATLHYKFHDAITAFAAAQLDSEPLRYGTSEIHLKIAERARATMHDLRYYAAKNVVARFTRPAQVVKHLAASATVGDVESALSHHELTNFLLPPSEAMPLDRAGIEKELERWEGGGIFSSASSVADRYRYAFDVLYRGVIDRTHQLSRVNGADNAKLDLLRRLFPPIDGDSTFARLIRRPRSTFPVLPANLLTELLIAMAVAGLNAGQLLLAKWASEVALTVLQDWRKFFGDSPERRRFFVAITRVRVDILTRAGDLGDADDLCYQALKLESDYRDMAGAKQISQLQLRYAHIMYLTSGVMSATEYLGMIGLDVPRSHAESGMRPLLLDGLSGRIWISLLLKTLRGRRSAEDDAAMLAWARELLLANWGRTQGQANERVALMVLQSVIDRVCVDAIRNRKPDIIDRAQLPECRRLLRKAEFLAWNTGVSPATRIELEFEIARVECLSENFAVASDIADKLVNLTTVCGYRIYQVDAIFLQAEMLWELGLSKRDAEPSKGAGLREFQEAERLLDTLRPLERAAGYHSAHASTAFLRSGSSPMKQRIG